MTECCKAEPHTLENDTAQAGRHTTESAQIHDTAQTEGMTTNNLRKPYARQALL